MRLRRFLLAITLGVFLNSLLLGCGQETIGDMTQRQLDIAREGQDMVAGQYQLITGIYYGNTPTSDVFLSVDENRVNNGTSVSQSVLAGAFSFYPKIGVSKNNPRIKFEFSFTDGTYDPHSGILSFTLEKEGRASIIKCKADRAKNLSCKWNSKARFAINLSPVNQRVLESLSNSGGANDVSYKGRDSRYDISIQLEGGVVPRDGSKVAEAAILGGIHYSNANGSVVNSGFKDGTFDFQSGRITLLLDDDIHITIICKILENGKKLHCNWNSHVQEEFDLVRTVEP